MVNQKDLREKLPSQVKPQIVESIIHEKVDKAWEDSQEIVFEEDKYLLRHHISKTYLRQLAYDSYSNQERVKFPRFKEIESNTLKNLESNIDINSEHFAYSLEDKFRYSDKIEAFLGKGIENEVGPVFSSINKFITNYSEAPETANGIAMSARNKMDLSIFIAAQWAKAEPNRKEFIKDADEVLLANAKIGAFEIYQRPWVWISSKNWSLPFNKSPVFAYAKKITDFSNYQEVWEEKNWNQYFTSIGTAPFLYFPFSKNVLIVIGHDFFNHVKHLLSLGDVALTTYSTSIETQPDSTKDLLYLGNLANHTINITNTENKTALGRLDTLFFKKYTNITARESLSFYVNDESNWRNKIPIKSNAIIRTGFSREKDYESYLRRTGQMLKRDIWHVKN